MGRVYTFYSFKGGVGRTMSLANVAYLCAAQGLRVLVMDWDLEAPGLSYYFRGLVEPRDQPALMDAPGALNVLWQWRNELTGITSREQADELVAAYAEGTPFKNCVRSVFNAEDNYPGVLDYISAGSEYIDNEKTFSYGDALSAFPWGQLHDKLMGETLVNLWRNWAKSSYEVILIDSRTGFADVAGLCTMAFPDEVVLCMALNRQNIDGTARVAAEIRRVRAGSVTLRVAPMRIAREGTGEQNGAIASARNALMRVGGFAQEDLLPDFEALGVPAVEGVPFQETLAPFAASNSQFDPLTLTYCRMATSLVHKEIVAPTLSEEQRERIRRRQDLRTATVEYLQKFNELEPALAVDELSELVASAHNLPEDQLSPTYVEALVDAAYSINRSTLDFGSFDAFDRLIGLVRERYRVDSSVWEAIFIRLLTKELNESRGSINEGEIENLALYSELDAILAPDERPARMRLRLIYMRRAIRVRDVLLDEDDSTVVQAVTECLQVAIRLLGLATNGSDEYVEALSAQAEMALALADMAQRQERSSDAMQWLRFVCSITVPSQLADGAIRQELQNSLAQGHLRLALLGEPDVSVADAARLALKGLALSPGLGLSYLRLCRLAKLFANPNVPVNDAAEFVVALGAITPRTMRMVGLGMPVRGTSLAEVIHSLAVLYERLAGAGWPSEWLKTIPALVGGLLETVMKRPRWVPERIGEDFDHATDRLIAAASRISDGLSELRVVVEQFRQTMAERTANQPHRDD